MEFPDCSYYPASSTEIYLRKSYNYDRQEAIWFGYAESGVRLRGASEVDVGSPEDLDNTAHAELGAIHVSGEYCFVQLNCDSKLSTQPHPTGKCGPPF